MSEQSNKAQANRRLLRKLILVSVAMFGFGFALWPLYDVFCDITGFGGRGIQIEETAQSLANSDREITIRFDANVNSELPWLFQPKENTMKVRLGELSETLYLAMNNSSADSSGQASYNVTPPEASLYFVKTECFCFTQQLLAAQETREMPVYFYVQADLPEKIQDITLSYTFHPDQNAPDLAQN